MISGHRFIRVWVEVTFLGEDHLLISDRHVSMRASCKGGEILRRVLRGFPWACGFCGFFFLFFLFFFLVVDAGSVKKKLFGAWTYS